jgi:tetratricopeptide (TPR) repeat protein
VASAANHLGDILRAQGDLAGARAYLERALRIMEAEAITLGTDYPDLATTAGNLARVLQAQGELSRAGALYERSLRFFQTCLGENHRSTVWVRTHLQSLGG